MAKEKGWIKLHRSITNNPIWKATKKEPFDKRSAWIDLLLMANHEERMIYGTNSGKPIVIQPGQLHTSMDHLAERWQWSRNKGIRFFKQLAAQGMVTVNGTPDGTTVTIINWGLFQSGGTRVGAGVGTMDGTIDGTMDGTQTRNIYTRTNNKNENKKTRKRVPGSYSEDDFE